MNVLLFISFNGTDGSESDKTERFCGLNPSAASVCWDVESLCPLTFECLEESFLLSCGKLLDPKLSIQEHCMVRLRGLTALILDAGPQHVCASLQTSNLKLEVSKAKALNKSKKPLVTSDTFRFHVSRWNCVRQAPLKKKFHLLTRMSTRDCVQLACLVQIYQTATREPNNSISG